MRDSLDFRNHGQSLSPSSTLRGDRRRASAAVRHDQRCRPALRHLKRFLSGGLSALARRKAPGAAPTITPEWKAELLRVIDLDPHTLGVASANWTTTLLADYLAQVTGIVVTEETVRLHLHANGYVCKRPTWTLKRKAEAQEGYVGNA